MRESRGSRGSVGLSQKSIRGSAHCNIPKCPLYKVLRMLHGEEGVDPETWFQRIVKTKNENGKQKYNISTPNF